MMFLIEWFDIAWFWFGRIVGGLFLIVIAFCIFCAVLEWILTCSEKIASGTKKYAVTPLGVLVGIALVCLVLMITGCTPNRTYDYPKPLPIVDVQILFKCSDDYVECLWDISPYDEERVQACVNEFTVCDKFTYINNN